MSSPTPTSSSEGYTVGDPPSPVPNRRRPAFELEGFTSLTGSRSTSPEPLHTPTLGESFSSLKRNLSAKSLRELEAKHVQEALWRPGGRDGGNAVHRPRNLEQIFGHAVRGGASKTATTLDRDHPTHAEPMYCRIGRARRSYSRWSEPRRRCPSDYQEAVRIAWADLLLATRELTVSPIERRGINSGLVLQALFGPDTFRFGTMMGAFTFL